MTNNWKSSLGIAVGILGLAAIGLIGLKIPPRRYPHPSRKTKEIGGFDLPDGLPDPVKRHFLASLGITPPQMKSAVIWGRGRLKFNSLWMPLRFRCHFQDGQIYLKEIQITWFGFPYLTRYQSYNNDIMSPRTNEGEAFESGNSEKHGNYLSMWAESMWMPVLLLSERAARWEAIDESAAWLLVSSNGTVEPILSRFNPNSGLIEEIIALCPQTPGGEKSTWRVGYSDWKPFHRLLLPAKIITSWDDKGAYSVLNAEGVEYNPDISRGQS
ncbi:MAG: hypothetical protein IBX69_16365 [Anaerolineales bacterium]|nr:hypothetical protein [Anaerolineales bacterium]